GRGTDDGYDVALDTRAHGGRYSLRLTPGGVAGSVRVEQRVAAWAAPPAGAPDSRRLRLAGFVRTANGRPEDAALWLRVTGSGGGLFADSSGASNGFGGGFGGAAGDVNPRAASVPLASPADAAPDWRRVEI